MDPINFAVQFGSDWRVYLFGQLYSQTFEPLRWN